MNHAPNGAFSHIIIADLQLVFNNLQVGFCFLGNFLVSSSDFARVLDVACNMCLETEQETVVSVKIFKKIKFGGGYWSNSVGARAL